LNFRPLLTGLALTAGLAVQALAADLTAIDRSIAKEPTYTSQLDEYGKALVVFLSGAK
jgi:hypothetical protein